MASKNSAKPNKLVRDSFTIPKAEFATIDALKTRAIRMGSSVKKSELLRAGLMVLKRLSDGDFKTAIAAVPTLKTGRPSAEPTPPKKAAAVAKPAVAAKAPVKAAVKPAAKAAVKPAAKPAAKVKPVAQAAPKAVEKKVVAPKSASPAPRKPAAKTVASKAKAVAPAKAAVPAKAATPAKPTASAVKPAEASPAA